MKKEEGGTKEEEGTEEGEIRSNGRKRRGRRGKGDEVKGGGEGEKRGGEVIQCTVETVTQSYRVPCSNYAI